MKLNTLIKVLQNIKNKYTNIILDNGSYPYYPSKNEDRLVMVQKHAPTNARYVLSELLRVKASDNMSGEEIVFIEDFGEIKGLAIEPKLITIKG